MRPTLRKLAGLLMVCFNIIVAYNSTIIEGYQKIYVRILMFIETGIFCIYLTLIITWFWGIHNKIYVMWFLGSVFSDISLVYNSECS